MSNPKNKIFKQDSKENKEVLRKYARYAKYIDAIKKSYFKEHQLDDKYFFPKIEGIAR